jgi:hypothetical protein
MASRILPSLDLSAAERGELSSLAARWSTALALRARIVLACAKGALNKDVAERLQVERRPSANGTRI